jgi:hypothetical protein
LKVEGGVGFFLNKKRARKASLPLLPAAERPRADSSRSFESTSFEGGKKKTRGAREEDRGTLLVVLLPPSFF